ncbi:hypothetical protein SCHPADRAFT_1001659 [Schizopora paradoxa]|uniref:Uncharacterized protein n=1 Tax=Schizopora paradoxa TaxID=27342 RepID=A0A0H2R7W7_9AGAM|nr:hypothetical protein SCHPADRAFT_1001659 [Schizopora paradoxa]
MQLQRRRTSDSRVPTATTAEVTQSDDVVVSHIPKSPMTAHHNYNASSSASSSRPQLSQSYSPRRHRHSRSMNAVPTLHTISAEDEDAVVPACAGSRASKLMAFPFMRRQMHFRKSGGGHSDGGLLSTPAERSASSLSPAPRSPPPSRSSRSSSSSTSRYRSPDLSAQPPTIAQIAMGLHVSRTPHLRPQPRRLHSEPSVSASMSATPSGAELKSNDRRGRSTAPKQPLRSSMKKSPAASVSAASLSTSISMSASASPHRLSVASSMTTPPSSIAPSPQSTFSKLSLALGHGSNAGGKLKNKFRLFGINAPGNISTATSSSDPSIDEEDIPRKSVRFMSVEEDTESSGLGLTSVEPEGIVLVSRPDQE